MSVRRTDQKSEKMLGIFFQRFIEYLRKLTDTFILLGIPNKEKYLIFMLCPHEIPNIHALMNTDGRTERTNSIVPVENFFFGGDKNNGSWNIYGVQGIQKSRFGWKCGD